MQASVVVAAASGSATDRPPWAVVKTANDRGTQARSRNPIPTGIRIVLPTGGPFYRPVFVFASQVRSAESNRLVLALALDRAGSSDT